MTLFCVAAVTKARCDAEIVKAFAIVVVVVVTVIIAGLGVGLAHLSRTVQACVDAEMLTDTTIVFLVDENILQIYIFEKCKHCNGLL